MLATLQGQTGWDGGGVRYRRVGTPLLILHLLIIAGGETGSRADVAGLLPVALLQSSSAVLACTFVDRRRECFQYIVSIHPTPRPPTDVQSMNFKTDVPSLYCCHCDHLSTPSHHTFSIKLTGVRFCNGYSVAVWGARPCLPYLRRTIRCWPGVFYLLQSCRVT